MKPVYLDCNATTPLDPRVGALVQQYLTEDFGNAGSRTHSYGAEALKAVQKARAQVASVVDASPEEVVFTSGATESNNIALLGLAAHGIETGNRHIISTQIEHKAVLEPLRILESRGFKVTLLPPNSGGWVEPDQVADALQPDTLLVSVMHVNNETGVVQPLDEIAGVLAGHPAFFHTDAAQGFGKELSLLQNARIDLLSISAHKVYGPKGVGALVARRRKHRRPPVEPLAYGGGQERGLRPGTLPVPLVVGLGEASRLALEEASARREQCTQFREALLGALSPLDPAIHGDLSHALPNVVNLSFGHIDSEAIILGLRDIVAVSNGSACTSASYEPSHVLRAMRVPQAEIAASLRWSWCHCTPTPPWDVIFETIAKLY